MQNLNPMQRIIVWIFAILVLILAVVLTMTRLKRENADEETSKQSSRSSSDSLRPAEINQRARPSPRSPVPMVALDSRAKQLTDLKKHWLRLGEHRPGRESKDDSMYRDKLSKESARMLLCSAEAIELIRFLKKEQIYNTVETEIEHLFESDLAGEARQILASLPDTRSNDGTIYGTNYRRMWSNPAGKGCPPEEFNEFCSALGNAVSVQEAVFGHNMAMAQTDPIGALTSTLNQVETGTESLTKNSSVDRLILALPPGTDFEQVDKLLLASETEDASFPFCGSRSAFVRVWSKDDPTAAANYLMEHPDRFPVLYINIPVMEALARDLTTGIEWIQTFPDGPYFDTAVRTAISQLKNGGNPKEALQLASQIGDPATRKKIMEAALTPPEPYSENE